MAHQVCVIPGDGIGPEVVSAAQEVLSATGVQFEWVTRDAGAGTFEKTGEPLPDETLNTIRDIGLAIKGPTATPSGVGFRSVNVKIRQQLELFANFRPARSMEGTKTLHKDVDLLVIRENTEGLYSGIEHVVVPGVVESLRIITEKGSQRVIRYAFETARRLGKKKVTVVHKANILKLSDGLFLRVAREVATEYDDIEFDECIVDACAMKLVLDPHQFDVLVMENLFGDIVSDLCAGLVGGLGLTPSANIGENVAVFEAVHGTAPDIAGKALANPTALILSGVLMLRHVGETAAADSVESAVRKVIAAGEVVTGDLGGKAGTREFTSAVINELA